VHIDTIELDDAEPWAGVLPLSRDEYDRAELVLLRRLEDE